MSNLTSSRTFYSDWNDIIENKDYVYNSWKDLGFLEGLGEYGRIMSYWYEYGAGILNERGISEKAKNNSLVENDVTTFYFPVLRRIFTELFFKEADDYPYYFRSINVADRNNMIKLVFRYKQKIFEEILDKLIMSVKDVIPPMKKIHDDPKLDVEAEVTANFCTLISLNILSTATDLYNYLNMILPKSEPSYKSIDRFFKISKVLEKDFIDFFEDFPE